MKESNETEARRRKVRERQSDEGRRDNGQEKPRTGRSAMREAQ